MSLLTIDIKEACYGKKIILSDNYIEIIPGKISSIIGPNGAGKSTFLKAIMGIVKISSGRILFKGQNIANRQVEKNVKDGISFIPQGNRVFMNMSVYENLEIGGYLIDSKMQLKEIIDAILSIFPLLKDKLKSDAGDLSGGEKQQLALARVLILQPEILLLDEPSLGLAPQLVTRALETIKEINKNFKTTILVVEQKVREVLKIADYVYALRMGKFVFTGTPEEIQQGDNLKKIFLL
jgi:branched-chain amino acid transport system ATP-binding protein